MDSFCFPIAPCPAKKPFLEPSVPDASLLLNAAQPNSYQAWRSHFKEVENKKVTTSILKKQVRFDSPSMPSQQIQMNSKTEEYKTQNQQDSSTQYSTPPLNKVLKNKPFQEIYMANIPNRHLDLSLIDLNRPVNASKHSEVKGKELEEPESSTPPKKAPTTYREFLEMQKSKPEETNRKIGDDHCITDIFNYTSPRIDPWRKKDRTNKFKQMEAVENDLDDLHNRKKLSNLYSNTNVSEKENMCYDNRKFGMTEKDFNLEKDDGVNVGKTCDSSVQTSLVSTEDENKQVQAASKSDEPTVKDLLKIIQQQNEQLLLLQKQVASLLDFKETQKCIEPNIQRTNENNQFLQPMKETRDYLNSAGSTPRKGPLPKFSIDLMTSFEVSFRPQQNVYQRKQRDFIGQEPKIQEIVEGDADVLSTDVGSRKGIADPSLYLQNPITVPEDCPSPEPSINIDMKDYESSDDDDNSASFIGASFYRKMMDQVNKIIQNAQRQATIDGKMTAGNDMTERTLSKVRDATIKQLKKINMNFSPIEEVSSSNCSEMSDDSDQINLAVKQLLMKYLPDDQLTKLHREDNRTTNKKRNGDKIILNSRAPQFSFATVQFMKKYDLIANNGNDGVRRPDVQERSKPTRAYKGQQNPKILDISSLKQQPKLL